MTKFPHDQFAKEYLQELLSPLGEVETSKDVTAEVREIDIWFQPTSFEGEYIQSLGLLGKMAVTALPLDDSLRANALQLLYTLQANLQANTPTNPAGDDEDQELVMAIVPLFQQHLQEAQQQGREQGREEGQRLILESFLQVRFGDLDPLTLTFLRPISALPTAEFTMLLVQLSMLPIAQTDRQQVQNLLAESVLSNRFSASAQVEQRPVNLIPDLLALSPENLSLLLSELPQLSLEDLMARLSERST